MDHKFVLRWTKQNPKRSTTYLLQKTCLALKKKNTFLCEKPLRPTNLHPKGQLISKGFFDVIVSTNKTTYQRIKDFCPSL